MFQKLYCFLASLKLIRIRRDLVCTLAIGFIDTSAMHMMESQTASSKTSSSDLGIIV
jgi:hypothetical protein